MNDLPEQLRRRSAFVGSVSTAELLESSAAEIERLLEALVIARMDAFASKTELSQSRRINDRLTMELTEAHGVQAVLRGRLARCESKLAELSPARAAAASRRETSRPTDRRNGMVGPRCHLIREESAGPVICSSSCRSARRHRLVASIGPRSNGREWPAAGRVAPKASDRRPRSGRGQPIGGASTVRVDGSSRTPLARDPIDS